MRPRAPRRSDDGKFSGCRVNIDEVPRLPAFPARWTLEDPRRRSYFVFWPDDREEGRLLYAVRMVVEGEDRVGITRPDGRHEQIQICWRPLPCGARELRYLCFWCDQPRRYLYAWALRWWDRRVTDDEGWRCAECARLRWPSQGAYNSAAGRALLQAFATNGEISDRTFVTAMKVAGRLEICPKDPRAVSDPRMVADEFPRSMDVSAFT